MIRGWKILSALTLALCCVLSVAAVSPEKAVNLPLAGWSEVDITPPLGIALGGRAGPGTTARFVLDPLYAQVLILKDGKKTNFVLVSFDLVGLPHDLSDRLRTRMVHELGAEWNLVVLNASHTHSGPYMLRSLMAGVGPPPQNEVDYFNFLEERIVSASRQAVKSMKLAEVEVFAGKSTVGINRRGRNAQGMRGLIPDASGPFDENLWVMRVTPRDGSPPAVIFSYACHAVAVYGFAPAAISADFPGVARNRLKEALGTNAHVQFVQGFAGNIRPRELADLEHNRFRAARSNDVQKVGGDLAAAVLASLKTPATRLELNLAGTSDRPFLPRDKPPTREVYERMRAEALARTNEYHLAVSDYWLRRYDRGEGFALGDVWSLGLIRLADNQWIVYSGGEPCIEWREKISGWLSPLDIVPWGYCQESKSYLPTESLLSEGGYEVLQSNEARESTPAPFAPGIEKAVRESLQRQLTFLKARVK